MLATKLAAFISYSHEDGAYAGNVKNVLTESGIEAFLAHEDLKVSEEWRNRIMQELRRCDVLIPLLSTSILKSLTFSTSAHSPNLIYALEDANAHAMLTVGFSGKDGGRLADTSQHRLNATTSSTHRIQEPPPPSSRTPCTSPRIKKMSPSTSRIADRGASRS